MAKKLYIGITGGIGSGKSEVTQRFERLGINVIDTDVVAREVVTVDTPALKAIAEHFGGSILLDTGELNRAKLRDVIFKYPSEKKWLEALLHPIIRTAIVEQLQAAHSPYVILSSPLLLETDQHKLVDRILVVDAPPELQIARATARDNNTEEQIKNIINTQLQRDERLAKADDIIVNHNSLIDLQNQVEKQHDFYLSLLKFKPSEIAPCKNKPPV